MQIVHLVYHSGSGSGSVSAETLLQRSVSDSVSAERGFKKYGLVSVSAEIRKSVSVGLYTAIISGTIPTEQTHFRTWQLL